MSTTQFTFDINTIRPPKIRIHPYNNIEDIIDSIEKYGILSPIIVTGKEYTEGGRTYYLIIDGVRRYLAAKELGLENITCTLIEASISSEEEILILPTILNSASNEEYRNHVLRLLLQYPKWTIDDCEKALCKSKRWVYSVLGLNNIVDSDILNKVDKGKICLVNAEVLSRLNKEDQRRYVEDARNMKVQDFVPRMTSVINSYEQEQY